MSVSQRPEVSIVVGVRNGGEELLPSLESVLKQTQVELELLVVDDGSTDATPELLAGLAAEDARVRFWRQQPQGLTAALAFACQQARAPYLARQDVGDRSLPGRLEQQREVLRQEPGVALVSCRTDCFGPAGEWLWTERGVTPQEDRPVPILERRGRTLRVRAGPTSHGSALFRRETYEAVGGYRTEFLLGQDWDLWQRMGLLGAYYQVGRVLYARTLSPRSLSARFRREQHAFGRLSLKAVRRRAAGESEEGVLERAERLSRKLRGRQLGLEDPLEARRAKAELAYFAGSMLLAREPEVAARYLALARELAPWSLRVRWKLARSKKRRTVR